jgi:F-type H+-transporting ATPase subunit delta
VIREVAAKRYAEAAYLIAQQDGKQDIWSRGLSTVSALFGDEQGRAVFESTRVSAANKLSLVENGLAGVDPLVLNLARLLLRRGRTDLGPQVAEAFQELVDRANGISHAIVTTAIALSAEEMKAVQQRLAEINGGPVIVETRVDEGILGGLVARIGDRLIDGSTISKLRALKRQLVGART